MDSDLLICAPTNPVDGEQIVAVEVLPLHEAQARFLSCGRPDLADLCALAAQVKTGSFPHSP